RPEAEAAARQATGALYHAATAALLAWEGAQVHARRGDARRLLLSSLVVEHRLTPRDPYAAGDTAREDRISKLLLDDAPVPLDEAATLLGT
ncbi:MAG TPA: DNA alkylation response protein, partial [Alphaproteobacteria bacterium]|nr:DNA alkylation response protein [Alphaproteobacteria bacterium]